MHPSIDFEIERVSLPLEGQALLEAIARRKPRLSATLQGVASFCLEHHALMHRYTITEVARACGTVPSTVVRFARVFRHSGYQSFKLAFVVDAHKRREPIASPAEETNGMRSTALRMEVDSAVRALSVLRTLLESQSFWQTVYWLRNAHVLLLSFCSELDRLVALHLGNKLQHLGKRVMLSYQTLPNMTHMPSSHSLWLDFDLARDTLDTPASTPGQRSIRQVQLLGHTPKATCTESRSDQERVVLVLEDANLSHRLQMALSLSDLWSAALEKGIPA